jgi:hypothetical protein
VADDFHLTASSLHLDRADVDSLVEVLAARLEGALPGHTTVKRRRRGKRVERVAVELGPRRFMLERRRHELAATVESAVHDMRRRREELSLDAWLAALEAELRQQAESSAAARDALERLLSP